MKRILFENLTDAIDYAKNSGDWIWQAEGQKEAEWFDAHFIPYRRLLNFATAPVDWDPGVILQNKPPVRTGMDRVCTFGNMEGAILW